MCICFNKETKMSSAWPSLPAGSPLRAHRLCTMTTCCVSSLLNAKPPDTNERRDELKDVQVLICERCARHCMSQRHQNARFQINLTIWHEIKESKGKNGFVKCMHVWSYPCTFVNLFRCRFVQDFACMVFLPVHESQYLFIIMPPRV